MSKRPRLATNLEFPRYAFVPGRNVHPRRAQPGAHGLSEPVDEPTAIRFGVDLFNHGYFWEAHEVWETPWQQAAAGSDRKLFLQALIRLAAAALKLRVGNAAGVRAHAPWCAMVFADLARRHATIDGLAPVDLAGVAHDLGAGTVGLRPLDGSPEPVLDRELVLAAGP
jgi:hypothetical protein